MNLETRIESSVPVQSRISLVDLANLVKFWNGQGFEIRTMSQLVAWSVGLLSIRLNQSGLMPEKISDVAEAHRLLIDRGLYQRSLEKRTYSKVATAMGFDELRQMGIDPLSEAPGKYKVMHNHPRSSQLNMSEVPSQEEVDRMARLEIQRLKHEKLQEAKEKARSLQAARDSGVVVDDQWLMDRQRAEQEIRDRENQPLDFDEMKKNLIEE